MDYDLQGGARFGGVRFDIGKGEDFSDRMTIGDRGGGADDGSVMQDRFAAVAVRVAIGFNLQIGADPRQVCVEGFILCRCNPYRCGQSVKRLLRRG